MCGIGRYATLLVVASSSVAMLGCGPKHEDLKAFLKAHEHKVSASGYRITPPDVLMISAPGCPEVDGDSQQVRVDGMVSLRLLGEVRVVGLTPSEVSAKLEELLKRYYVDPKVHVRVGGYNSKEYYVLGQVERPGPRTYTGRDTLMQALADSRPNFLAWKSQVKVIRPSPNKDEKHVITVDIDEMVKEGDMRMNFLLQEGDIVYVPETPMAWLGLRIREVLYPVSPVFSAYTTPSRFLDASDNYRYRDERNRYYRDDDDDDDEAWRWMLRR